MSKRLPQLKILLVDPDPSSCKFYWTFLRECGQVITASDVYTAEKQFMVHRPHVIVTMLFDRHFDSAELMRKFLRRYEDLYAYFVIGLVSSPDLKPIDRSTVDPRLMEVLVLPVYIGQLLDTVRELGKEIRIFRELEKEAH